MISCKRFLLCLCISFILPSLCCAQTEDPTEIRREIVRLTTAISEHLKQIAALEKQLNSGTPRIGLEGYCPVSVVDDNRWTRGSLDHNVEFEGYIFYFADAQRKQEYELSPLKYTPAAGGFDPVILLEKGEHVVGLRKYGFICYGRVVLCANEESVAKFGDAPERYRTLVRAGSALPVTAENEDQQEEGSQADE